MRQGCTNVSPEDSSPSPHPDALGCRIDGLQEDASRLKSHHAGKGAFVTDQHLSTNPQGTDPSASGTFSWHPTYAGQTFDSVERGLAAEIGRDQRQYHLALDGAEQSEHESLSSVVELERRWGNYAFDWAEMEPAELASRIVAFERERERRQEMIPFADYRAEGGLVGGDSDPRQGRSVAPSVWTIAIAVVAVIVIVMAISIALG